MSTILAAAKEMPNADYRGIDAVSASGLAKIIRTTPAHYLEYITGKREATPAQEFGTAVHAAILEPDLFSKAYVQKPEGLSLATKEGKEWKLSVGGKKILSFEDFRAVQFMSANVLEHPVIGDLIEKGIKEKSFFWTDPETGLLCKCRPDCFIGDKVIDIKTAEDASPRGFQSSIQKWGYATQSVHYLEGMSHITGKRLTDFIHVVVEKSAPFAVACYVLDDASLERAAIDVRRGLALIKDCRDKKQWPAYQAEIQTTNLPHWAFGTEFDL